MIPPSPQDRARERLAAGDRVIKTLTPDGPRWSWRRDGEPIPEWVVDQLLAPRLHHGGAATIAGLGDGLLPGFHQSYCLAGAQGDCR